MQIVLINHSFLVGSLIMSFRTFNGKVHFVATDSMTRMGSVSGYCVLCGSGEGRRLARMKAHCAQLHVAQGH